MAATRPTVRTQVDLPVPDLVSPLVAPWLKAWGDVATRTTADALTQANRRWLQWWFDSATKAVDAWWATALPRR